MPLAPRTTVEEKVGAWLRAFQAIREEITPAKMREVIGAMEGVEGFDQLQSYVLLSRLVTANDRAAAIVAGMLVSGGFRPVPVEDMGEVD